MKKLSVIAMLVLVLVATTVSPAAARTSSSNSSGTQLAWCPPAFWRNATDAAWALTGYSKQTLFNYTVVPTYYDQGYADTGELYSILLNKNYYDAKGLNRPPFGLTPYRAVAAFLSDNIPGYDFSLDAMKGGNTCPIDIYGNFIK